MEEQEILHGQILVYMEEEFFLSLFEFLPQNT